MKIFNEGHKINFVDDNNLFVGFDYSKYCCEFFGYSFSHSAPKSTDVPNLGNENSFNLDAFNFDKNYFKEIPDTYSGGGAVFRLTKGDEQIFLTILNSHNGYYVHGFEFGEIKGETFRSGNL